MTRRSAIIAAAALALVVAPAAAATAYEAPGINIVITDGTPGIGQTVTITITGCQPGEAITITITSNPTTLPNDSISIAGTKSLTKNANAAGVVTFAVTPAAAGTFTAVATDASGAIVADQVLTVGAAAAAPGASGSDSGLAVTGFDGAGIALAGGALVLAGAGAVVIARRRQAHQG